MRFFTESPIPAENLHHKLTYLVDKVVSLASDDCSVDDIQNLRSECEFRFGILESRCRSFGNPVFVCYIEDDELFLLQVFDDEFHESKLDLSQVPKGMEEVYITTYIQNIIMEIDPFVDYDICQVLCEAMDPMALVSYSDDGEEIFH